MKHLSDYLDLLKAKGDFCFTSKKAKAFLNCSQDALRMSLVRMRRKKEIVTLSKRFHLIIPAEYRSIGCLPASQFIAAYMQFLKLPYYVCLLSAAEFYGAAHQKPQVFQVMTNKQLKPINCGKVTIKFYRKKNLTKFPTNIFTVPTGYIKVATPEVTAMDLLRYSGASGGINHIATVLTELINNIDPQKLEKLANKSNEIAWVQRLGYILQQIEPLETTNQEQCIQILKKFVQRKLPPYTTLINKGAKRTSKNTNWRIIVNCKIESDI